MVEGASELADSHRKGRHVQASRHGQCRRRRPAVLALPCGGRGGGGKGGGGGGSGSRGDRADLCESLVQSLLGEDRVALKGKGGEKGKEG